MAKDAENKVKRQYKKKMPILSALELAQAQGKSRDDAVRELLIKYKRLDMFQVADLMANEATFRMYHEACNAPDPADRIKALKDLRKSIPERHEVGTGLEDMVLAVRGKLSGEVGEGICGPVVALPEVQGLLSDGDESQPDDGG